MFHNVEELYLTPNVEEIDGKIRIELYSNVGKFYGILYYEPVKRGFANKPLSMNKWGCVDATLQESLYLDFPTITPTYLLQWGMSLISHRYMGTEDGRTSHTYELPFRGGDSHNHTSDEGPNTPHYLLWSGTTHEGNSEEVL